MIEIISLTLLKRDLNWLLEVTTSICLANVDQFHKFMGPVRVFFLPFFFVIFSTPID